MSRRIKLLVSLVVFLVLAGPAAAPVGAVTPHQVRAKRAQIRTTRSELGQTRIPSLHILPPDLGERAVIEAAIPRDVRRMLARRLVMLGRQLNQLAGRLREQRALARLDERLGHPVLRHGVLRTCPVAGATTFTDDFGAPRPGDRTHEGVDLSGPAGRPIVAVQPGAITQSSSVLGGLGVHLRAHDGDEFYYAHLSAYEASGHVRAGTIIGRVGSTGDATGPHLHFEYHPEGGTAADPYRFLRGVCLRASRPRRRHTVH